MFYTHDNHDDIPFFSPIKMFQDLKDDDKVYILNLTNLEVTEAEISDLLIEDKEETVYDCKWVEEDKPVEKKEKSILNDVFNSVVDKLTEKSKVIVQQYIDTKYKYKSVSFSINTVDKSFNINIPFGTETSYIIDNKVICTSEREIGKLKNIIYTKCDIQMGQFKSIFHGKGYNYEPKHYKCN